MVFCHNCGENCDGANFCHECGTVLKQSAEKKTAPAAPAPAPAPAVVTAPAANRLTGVGKSYAAAASVAKAKPAAATATTAAALVPAGIATGRLISTSSPTAPQRFTSPGARMLHHTTVAAVSSNAALAVTSSSSSSLSLKRPVTALCEGDDDSDIVEVQPVATKPGVRRIPPGTEGTYVIKYPQKRPAIRHDGTQSIFARLENPDAEAVAESAAGPPSIFDRLNLSASIHGEARKVGEKQQPPQQQKMKQPQQQQTQGRKQPQSKLHSQQSPQKASGVLARIQQQKKPQQKQQQQQQQQSKKPLGVFARLEY